MLDHKKFVVMLSLTIFLVLILSVSVSAITAKIGNGRMILNVEVGETVDRTVRVINDNDVAVNVNVFPTGDLESDVELFEETFVLQPGEEKKVRFKIPVKAAGRSETRINVQFNPIEGGNGVGISSQIIINAGAVGSMPDEDVIGEVENNGASENEGITGFSISLPEGIEKSHVALGLSTIVLLILLLVLLYFSKKIVKRSVNGGDSKKIKKEVVDQ